jgi:hypothetical protein
MNSIISDNDTAYTVRYLQRLKEMYWTQKLGYYPTRIEKVGRKVSWEEANKEKEKEDLEFEVFLKSIK